MLRCKMKDEYTRNPDAIGVAFSFDTFFSDNMGKANALRELWGRGSHQLIN